MTTSLKTIRLSALSKTLALRNNADKLFDAIEKMKEKEIVVDFKGITMMSRSFAHQYLLRKSKIKKQVREVFISTDVQKMFTLVEHPKKVKFFEPKKFEVIELSA